MDREELLDFIHNTVVPGITANLERDGYLAPVTLILYGQGRMGVAIPESLTNDQEKFNYARAVEELACASAAQAAITCLESSFVNLKREEADNWHKQVGRPSRDPRALDVVVIFATTHTGEFAMFNLHFSKADEIVIVGQLKDMGHDRAVLWPGHHLPNPWQIPFGGEVDR